MVQNHLHIWYCYCSVKYCEHSDSFLHIISVRVCDITITIIDYRFANYSPWKQNGTSGCLISRFTSSRIKQVFLLNIPRWTETKICLLYNSIMMYIVYIYIVKYNLCLQGFFIFFINNISLIKLLIFSSFMAIQSLAVKPNQMLENIVNKK